MNTRRAANSMLTFMKIHLGTFHVLPGFYGFNSDSCRRLSKRLDTANDVCVLRNHVLGIYSCFYACA